MSNWLASTCMRVGSVSVTRRDVIQFVANKLGGVHLDSKREAAHPGYRALDQARQALQLGDLDAVYAELAAIGQQLANSPEVQATG
jgi:hypothetical protein